ncbi:ATPase [Parablastomonas sp. CN1-191]|uniref:ATPase n=1 Tax=Parablastomonas sp. CN1-191 TaxID=3400908 RepID=UPI003BF89825
MTGGRHIVAVGDAPQAPAEEELVLADEAAAEDIIYAGDDAPLPSPWRGRIAPALAWLAVAAWTGFFAWAIYAAGSPALQPQAAVGLLRDWALPVALIGVAWLIFQRNGQREAARFGAAARLLSDESARLESRLITINRELSLAREFIGAQARDLESLGRVSAERLSEHADRIAGLIHDNGARVETIGTVSATALDNMERLRGQLPVIASSAKDVTNNIAAAGRAAHSQLDDMIEGFNRLNQFGQASERQVESLRGLVDAAMGQFVRHAEQLETVAAARFTALNQGGEEFRQRLDRDEVAALAAIRTRAAALAAELEDQRRALAAQEAQSLGALRERLAAVRADGDGLVRDLRAGEDAALEAWRAAVTRLESDLAGAVDHVAAIDERVMATARERLAALDAEAAEVDARFAERSAGFAAAADERAAAAGARDSQALADMRERLAAFDAELAARHDAQRAHVADLAEHAEAISRQLDGYAGRMGEVAGHGEQARTAIAASLNELADNLLASREALAGTGTEIAGLTDHSVRLLELLQASARQTGTELPNAMAAGEARLAVLEERARALAGEVATAEEGGAALSGHIEETRATLVQLATELDLVHGSLGTRATAHQAALADLREALAATDAQATALSGKAQDELRAAIEALATAARDAVHGIETMSADAVQALAARIGAESGAAIDGALKERAAAAIAGLDVAAEKAAASGRETAMQLRDQLAKVSELAGHLEQRVAQARARATEQVDGDFARRAALITEALNSNAIDIARAMDAEVSDTEWAAYLKGDRGIFTRRAMRLLGKGEARDVHALYEQDADFREHVVRYIHDFEAMLRQLLATRDGNALSVTLLSSDMGKLYVALAQAIERIRR